MLVQGDGAKSERDQKIHVTHLYYQWCTWPSMADQYHEDGGQW